MSNSTNHIAFLEAQARQLEPGAQTHKSWHDQVFEYSANFISGIDERLAYDNNDQSLFLEDHPIAEDGTTLPELLEILARAVDRPGINPASGGHIGYIPGGGIVPSAYGDYLAAVTNRYAGIYFANPGAVRMENILIRWMAGLFGLPSTSHGNLASGGSIANLMGITTARDAMGIDSTNVRKAVIYLHEQTHHCVAKAIRIAGLGESIIRNVELDDRFRMRPEALENMVTADLRTGLKPFLIVASLGSTDTGAVDPIQDISQVAARHNLWLHADAAYGGFFILVDGLKSLFKGIEKVDSLVIDPHKGLFLPYGLGAVIVRDAQALHRSHAYTANYMQDAQIGYDEYSPAELSPELTKHFRGLRMWLPLKLFGLSPFRAALEEKWRLAQYFHKKIEEEGFEVGPEPELSVVIYRYVPPGADPNAFNRELISLMHRDGRIFISSTTIRGTVWLRLAVLCFRTHLEHVDTLISMLKEKRDILLSGGR